MSDSVTIYALADPREPTIPKYIGATSQTLKRRLVANICDRKQTPKRDWIQVLITQNLRPIIWPIEITDREHWEERETFWISHFRSAKLLNVQNGGRGGRLGLKHKPETLAGYSAARKGVQPSEQNKAITLPKLAQANLSRRKPVLCIETGQLFESIADAARTINFDDSHFRLYLKNNWKIQGKEFTLCPLH